MPHQYNINEFLYAHSTDLVALTSCVIKIIQPKPGDILYLSGSLAEGLGTFRSDIDIFYLSNSKGGRFGRSDFLELVGIGADIEYWEHNEVECLIERLEEFDSDQIRDPRSTLNFSVEERDFLHRFRVGYPIYGHYKFSEYISRIKPIKLSRLLVDRGIVRINTAHRDFIGYLEVDDYDSAAISMQTIAGFAADVLLAAKGNTNPGEKWRLRKLSNLAKISHDGEASIMGIFRIDEIAQLLRQGIVLDYSNRHCTTLSQFASQLIHVANIVTIWALFIFVAPHRLLRLEIEPRNSLRKNDQLLPGLALDVQMRYSDGKIVLRKLDHEDAFELNDIALDIVCMFDQCTSIEDLALTLLKRYQIQKSESTRHITDLVSILGDRDFLNWHFSR